MVSWGMPNWGGDSSAVKAELYDVLTVEASMKAFAAVRGDGTVITWGDGASGGDSSKVKNELKEALYMYMITLNMFFFFHDVYPII